MNARALASWFVCLLGSGCGSAALQSPRSAVQVVTPPPEPGCYDAEMIIDATSVTPDETPAERIEVQVEPTHFDDLGAQLLGHATRCHAESPEAAGTLVVRVRVQPNGELHRIEAEATKGDELPAALVACVARALERTITSRPSGCEARPTFTVRF